MALLIGLVATGTLTWASSSVYDHNETRLLDLRVRELGLALTAAVPSIQTPLASAAELANATNGDPDKFRAFMKPYVGPGRQFSSASLWPLGSTRLAPMAVAGDAPALLSSPRQARTFFARASRTSRLSVTGILRSTDPRLGYEFNTPGARDGFAVYAESPLPKDRRSRRASTTAFSDLNYVVYLGRSQRSEDLLVTNLERLPVRGRKATDLLAFGDATLTLVVTGRGSLGGAFFKRLPWIIAVVGVLLALAAALMSDRLARRRRQAEELASALDRVAADDRTLYTEQRSIAQTLQHAMLPERLPTIPGLDTSVRYIPAASGIDVGGDWYDIVAFDDRKILLLIGDVSGHGLKAANTMAALRHAALAYAAQDRSPASVLAALSDFVNHGAHDYFATVLCALVDVDAHRLTAASAGHLPPLLIDGERSRFVEVPIGTPIGAPRRSPYPEMELSVAAGATLIAFTDGLIERRAEILDVGLSRLYDAATARRLPLDELIATLERELAFDGHDDDTAILGIQWRD